MSSRRIAGLPLPRTPLVGRSREMATILASLRDTGVPLLTLTGPAGIGKTRLALQVAAADWGGDSGVSFVPLAPLRDPHLLERAIAEVLGLTDGGNQLVGEQVTNFLRPRRTLLVLDNCEHLLEAAPFIGELLTSCPRLQILATSRAPWQLSAERVYPVPPLTLPGHDADPSLDRLAQNEAVALFVQRANAINPAFALNEHNAVAVTEVCRRLDGLPLAIELAAARTRLLPVSVLLDRLTHRLDLLTDSPRDQPPHQRTMRDALAWSYDLLRPGEQRVFRQVAVFAGGFGLDAAEAIVDLDLPLCQRESQVSIAPEAIDHLNTLVTANLIVLDKERDEPRFSLLETLREFGLEQLSMNQEAEAVHDRHADYFLRLAEEADTQRLSDERAKWLDRLENERANLRAALTWIAPRQTKRALRLATALAWFWLSRNRLSEGRSWLERLLSVPETRTACDRPTLARAVLRLAALAAAQDDYEASELRFRQALEEFPDVQDPVGIARARLGLSEAHFVRGEPGPARSEGELSLALYREAGDAHGTARALEFLGMLAQEQDDYARATTFFHEALTLSRGLADWEIGANLLTLLGLTAQFTGDLELAVSRMQESLDLARTHNDVPRVAERLARLASVQLDIGNVGLARQLAEEALAVVEGSAREISPWTRVVVRHNLAAALRRSGHAARAKDLQVLTLELLQSLGSPAGWTATVTLELAHIYRELGDLRRSTMLAVQSVRLASDVSDRRGTATALEGLATTLGSAGMLAAAIRLIGAARRVRSELGAPIPPGEVESVEEVLEAAQARFGSAGVQRALESGSNARLHDIVAGSNALVSEVASAGSTVVQRPVEAPAPHYGLTAREREVLVLLIEGLSNPEIAANLFISQKTVRNHLTNIFAKLGVETRTAAATLALRQGLV